MNFYQEEREREEEDLRIIIVGDDESTVPLSQTSDYTHDEDEPEIITNNNHFNYDDYSLNYENNTNEPDEQDITYYHLIYNMEQEFIDSDKKNGQYIIGISAPGYNSNGSIFASGITASTFFTFPYEHVLKYLFYYSIITVQKPIVDIIKIHIDEDECLISIRKTFWLCLIQRHWKKLFTEKKRIINGRKTILSILYFQINGKYPKELRGLPHIHGLLYCYSRK